MTPKHTFSRFQWRQDVPSTRSTKFFAQTNRIPDHTENQARAEMHYHWFINGCVGDRYYKWPWNFAW